MIDVVRDRKLDYVVDTDPQVTKELGGLLCAYLDFEVPGFGITHDPEMPKDPRRLLDHRGVHRLHRELVLKALDEMGSSVTADRQFYSSSRGAGANTRLHNDSSWRFSFNNSAVELPNLSMALRVHTADSEHGADVVFAHTAPGLDTFWGDNDLFERNCTPTDEALKYGYDDQEKVWSSDLLQMIEDGGYDPLVIEPKMYRFSQTPNSSVVFRPDSSLGPTTAHAFYSSEPGAVRAFFISDLCIYTQSL